MFPNKFFASFASLFCFQTKKNIFCFRRKILLQIFISIPNRLFSIILLHIFRFASLVLRSFRFRFLLFRFNEKQAKKSPFPRRKELIFFNSCFTSRPKTSGASYPSQYKSCYPSTPNTYCRGTTVFSTSV